MIKVLDKAFGILELLVIASPDSVKPGAIAAALNINNASCSRILKDLSEAGYVEKISREAGYTVGPRAFTLSKQLDYNTELIKAAESCRNYLNPLLSNQPFYAFILSIFGTISGDYFLVFVVVFSLLLALLASWLFFSSTRITELFSLYAQSSIQLSAALINSVL